MKAVFMIVDFEHPQGFVAQEGDTVQVDDETAEEWANFGVARILGRPGSCRFCGCTEYDACVDDDGEACSWKEADICSSCINKKNEPGRGGPGSIELQGDQSEALQRSTSQR